MSDLPNSYLAAIHLQLGITHEMLQARQLPACSEAMHLQLAELGIGDKPHLLIPEAAAAWRNLKAAASADGEAIQIVSAFRSVERQVEIIRRKLAAGADINDILAVSAPPGFSEHHTGRAVDIATPDAPALLTEFEKTTAFAWLTEHAYKFGFISATR